MKKINLFKIILSILISCLWLPVFASTTYFPDSKIAPIISQFDRYVETTMQRTREPGAAIAIVYKGKIVFMKTYGVKRLGTRDPIDFDTVFQLGSISKTFAATLTAILQKQGKLNINDSVSYYLTNFSLRDPSATRRLRIKNILNHSSGVPRSGFNQQIEKQRSFEQMLETVKRTPLMGLPGQHFDYHNVMYSVIGSVIARVTRMSYSDALEYYLLNPLKMTRTTVSLNGLLRDNDRAYPHVRARKGGIVPISKYSQGYYHVAPAGGINSSIHDMAIYLKLQMGGYPSIIGERILEPYQTPSIATRETVYWKPGNRRYASRMYYGMGWRLLNFSGIRIVFHGGWLKGFINYIGFMPDYDIGIVVLHNAETRFPSDMAMKFFATYLGSVDYANRQ